MKSLFEAALEARLGAYAPYSGFAVGAALMTAAGKIYTGCNIENAAYSPTNCAERTAFFKAVSEGERDFMAIAIAGGPITQTEPEQYCPPCGVCRQVMAEFCLPAQFCVYLVRTPLDYRRFTLDQLLPEGFYPSSLTKKK